MRSAHKVPSTIINEVRESIITSLLSTCLRCEGSHSLLGGFYENDVTTIMSQSLEVYIGLRSFNSNSLSE